MSKMSSLPKNVFTLLVKNKILSSLSSIYRNTHTYLHMRTSSLTSIQALFVFDHLQTRPEAKGNAVCLVINQNTAQIQMNSIDILDNTRPNSEGISWILIDFHPRQIKFESASQVSFQKQTWWQEIIFQCRTFSYYSPVIANSLRPRLSHRAWLMIKVRQSQSLSPSLLLW